MTYNVFGGTLNQSIYIGQRSFAGLYIYFG